MHPFDIRQALLAKHAQHVVLVHFPIALFVMGVVFDLVGHWTKNRLLTAAAYYNLLAAAISTVPVLATGVIAWQWALEGEKLKGILLLHLLSACASSILICIVSWVHFRAHRNAERILPAYRLPVELVTIALVALTGHLGGFLSGVNLST